jgi:hypothetical protein
MNTQGDEAVLNDDQRALTSPCRQISYLAPSALTPHPNNARKHSRTQIRAIAKSMESAGFVAPVIAAKIATSLLATPDVKQLNY